MWVATHIFLAKILVYMPYSRLVHLPEKEKMLIFQVDDIFE